MATTITSVKPFFGKAGEAITAIGTGFVDSPESVVLCRKHGDAAWTVVDPSRVAYVSATELTLTLHATEFDGGGAYDIGVADNGETTPDAHLSSALFFYVAGLDDPDYVIVGAVDGVYVDGEYMGDIADQVSWDFTEEIKKIFTQHSNAPVKTFPGETTCELTVPLAEASLENFQKVLGAPAIIDLGDGRRRLTFGGRSAITYNSILIITPGPTNKKYALAFYRANVGFGGALTIGKDENMKIPMKLTVLEDTSRAVGDRIGRFEEYAIS